MSIPISQLTTGVPNGNVELPGTNPLDTTSSLNGTTFKYLLTDVLQYILKAQGFTTYTSCRVASTASLTATYNNGTAGVGATLTNAGAQAALVIDGVTLALNDRVLIKDQASNVQNGIYVVTKVGSVTENWILTRADDYNQPAEIVYLGVVAITQGVSQAGLIYQESSQGPFIIGTSPITFQQLQIDITLLPSASPANKILRSDGTYWVQSTNASLDSSDKLYDLSELQVDNININGNTISSTDVGGNIVITPNTVGSIVLDGLNWPQVDGTAGQAITTNGAGQLGWSTVSTVTTPTTDKAIAIFDGTNGALQNSSITIPSANALSGVSTIKDINNNTSLELTPALGAVNYWQVLNSATGNGIALTAAGSDSNINSYIIGKGDATITLQTAAVGVNPIQIISGTASQHNTSFAFANTAASRIVTFPDLTGTVALSGTSQSVSFGSLSLTTPLGISSGGTNTATLGTNGQLAQSDGTKYSWTTATYPATATPTGTILRADGTNWVATTATYPATTSINHILYSSANNVIGEIADAVGGVLVSDATGVPSMLANPADNYRVLMSKNADKPVWSTAAYPNTAPASGKIMQSDGTNWTSTQATYPSSTNKNHILYSSANNTVGEIGTQQHAVLVSDNNSVPQWSAGLNDGQIIIGKTNDLPAAANLTAGTGISITNGANSITITNTAPSTVTPAALTSVSDTNVTITLGGTPATALLQAASITMGWSGQLGVSRGGTGASTVGANGTLAQSNGSIYTFTTATYPSTTTANQLLYSSATNTVNGLTSASSATLVTNSSGVPAWTGSMTNGQVLIGSTGGTPTPATLTAGPGVSISNGAGSITISGTGSGIGWTEVTGVSQAMSADNGYVASNAGLVTLTLPTTAAFGTVINVQGKGAGGWKIAQNSGQVIHFGSVDTTTGATGYLASTNRYDSIQLLCITANTDWAIMTTQGVVTYN